MALTANLKHLQQLVCPMSEHLITYGELRGKHQIFPVDNSLKYPQPSPNWLSDTSLKSAKQTIACCNNAMRKSQCYTLTRSSSLLLWAKWEPVVPYLLEVRFLRTGGISIRFAEYLIDTHRYRILRAESYEYESVGAW